MTSKSPESIPTRLVPLVDPNPVPSTHNNIYKKGKKKYIQNGGGSTKPIRKMKSKVKGEKRATIPNYVSRK
jgi:hypothetical protein